MASLISKTAAKAIFRRSQIVPTTYCRKYLKKELEVVEKKEDKIQPVKKDAYEGLSASEIRVEMARIERERTELLPFESDAPIYKDPYYLERLERYQLQGTLKNPHIVTSCEDYRNIACICEEHVKTLEVMKIVAGPPQKCQCGYWFQLKTLTPEESVEQIVRDVYDIYHPVKY
ncbi:hypothetical protein LOTGIDRAFT_227974 [Lottia gigantea]|uniref:Cytochrome c oxidase subunit 5B, mitochondrial n=1 Tax=Lottia gigantea TaxID=225164 RepID=V4CS74_LOTGI|nr:hypothetical protein LOTGIDRAFT_227974 [Lottia gigantea]ESP05345.1 hypothetical protein LOTGIDRAFT_227974 [Lottia gigantea]